MTRITCSYGELDSETQDYLRDVDKNAGKRCPGVYVESDPKPWGKVAVGAGAVIAIGGMIWAFNTNKDAYAAAMLLAGTMLLGGWLLWFGFRDMAMTAGKGKGVYGRFTYFDPTHVYQVTGDEVTVTEVSAFRKVRAQPTGVLFVLDDGKLFVPLARQVKAELVERFYAAVLDVEDHDDPKWKKLDVADLGGVAKHIAVEGGFPISAESANLKVDTVPEKPRQDGGGSGVMRLLLPFTGAAIVFLLGILIFKPVRDNGAFDEAKAGGAPGLRGYLMDERNTKNRAEAKKLLAALYDPPIAKVKAAQLPEHAKTREGLAALLESLREAPQPVVSLQVKEVSELEGKENRESQLRTAFADALGLYVGQELIGVVKNPDDKKPHIELTYTITEGQLAWKLAFRPNLDGPAIEGEEMKLPMAQPQTVAGAVNQSIFQSVFGVPVPALPPPVVWEE